MDSPLHLDSVAVHAGRADLTALGVHALPIDLSSTNPLPDILRGGDSYEALAGGGYPLPEGGAVYQRLWNPTVARFETALAQLEQAATSVAFSSGMAAMTAAILASTSMTGRRHVVAVRPLYGGTDHLLATGLLGAEVTFCREAEVAAAIRHDTGLVVLETPANPTAGAGRHRTRRRSGGCRPRPGRQHVRHAGPAEPHRSRRGHVPAQRDEVPRRARRRRRRRRGLRRGERHPAAAGPRRHRRGAAPPGGLPAPPRPRDPAGAAARPARRLRLRSPPGSPSIPQWSACTTPDTTATPAACSRVRCVARAP